MKIGIIGSGVVAKTFGGGLSQHGHEVAVGTRDPAKLQEWAAQHSGLTSARSPTLRSSARSSCSRSRGSSALEALKSPAPTSRARR